MAATTVLSQLIDQALIIEHCHNGLVKGVQSHVENVDAMFHFAKNGLPIGRSGVGENATFMNVREFEDLLVFLNGSFSANAWFVVFAHPEHEGGAIFTEEIT